MYNLCQKLANIAQMCTKCVKMDLWHGFRYHIYGETSQKLKPNLTINVHVISTPNRLILAYIAGIQDFNNNTSDLARSQDTLKLEVIE